MPKRSAEGADSQAKRACTDPWEKLEYLSGFACEFASELLPGALPKGQNSPQIAPYGLYPEQLSGTAFTVPRRSNQRSWLYRIRPAVLHSAMVPYPHKGICADFGKLKPDPNQMRWQPQAFPTEPVDFVDGITTMAGADALAVHLYACNKSMTAPADSKKPQRSFQNSDGDMLIVPQEGALRITTEFGRMLVKPHEICVVQRCIRFSVDVEGPSRGYICELLRGHFEIPSLGPIGANGLANPRDFCTPVAWFSDYDPEVDGAKAAATGTPSSSVAAHGPAVASAAAAAAGGSPAVASAGSSSSSAGAAAAASAAPTGDGWEVINKFGHSLFVATQGHSPFDVVAWHGNYVPYKYNLDNFVVMNSVSVDHPDPSIYTVLTCPSDSPGTAICDFAIFPPRWMVMDKSFRPPYYHRNVMTEYMGMIYGKYDAKVGFVPGGSSLHSIGSAHGPDAATFKAASTAVLEPEKFDGGLAFMFETSSFLKLTDFALRGPHREWGYQACWRDLPALYRPDRVTVTPEELAAEADVAASVAPADSEEATAAAARAVADAVAGDA
ncbi:hypothetical protein FNF27_02835 [Cafeteria roenbergensis]|uniref:homogentisate 1,2-dioxygenase n=1 Tax=Cafeteria roenbergensis TaxID=33653 RepID=A0A5A8E456_CAFRO|nr:hypothetical protein FNF29_03210 [Cafeteria roenbergensis]KAA0161106.1 hypothetical protein FNF31_03947 [Cafeteria roenbergensis]KAA0170880.1 hypothetical protein FNF28_01153 [Cafeteria roenbergensis]KAA0175749.1 hypothetical protein FNF27_02835 [Cafeteria roenbergensis]|mmetsp:Transcript_9994/g.38883  ORF Transcript_9994/g.38883 Transcript_9994/m.38883 type:complete len:554 (-) Transcript_9994:99-1760(-)|eukprot:KAA0153393.1 hypothetical protein FNF29_03210 [Cafeteria roenbergensis]